MTARQASMPRLSLPEYAVLLSKALSCFSFPPVTLDVHTKGNALMRTCAG